MELKECITCGSHSFTGNKCDYCGNEYEVQKLYADDKLDILNYARRESFWSNEALTLPKEETKEPSCLMDREDLYYPNTPPIEFKDTTAGKKTLKAMIWLSVAIIWFAITVFIPPLFLLTICGLIIWGCKWLIKKGEKK